MKPSSGERAPQASMSRSESSRGVSVTVSRACRSSGAPPVRSTSSPPCGAIRCGLVATLMRRPPLERVVDAGEVLDLTLQRLLVQALRVAAGRLLDRDVDEDLDERTEVLDQ